METKWDALYKDLQASLQACQQQAVQQRVVECCFLASEKSSLQLKDLITTHLFGSVEEEIFFFRKIKPAFTSEVEYYSLLYHAELFKPTGNPAEVREFWLREKKRMEKFIEKYKDFYLYYTQGDTDKDGQYFLRSAGDPDASGEGNLPDPERESTTSYDELVASILALERYVLYVDNELESIAGSEEDDR
jgi:hypothetical protein